MKGDSIYMHLSALSYEDPKYVTRLAPEFGFVVGGFLTDGPSQGYLYIGQHQAVIAYRGTEASDGDLWDILSNVRFHAREWEGPGKAHLGYARQYRRIRDDALALINQVPSEKPLIVTGHSMGGAIATMAAADCFNNQWQVARVVTFGSPATLDKEGHDAIQCARTRYANKWDPAPLWPPSFSIDHGIPATKIDSKTSVFNRHAPQVYIRAMELYDGR